MFSIFTVASLDRSLTRCIFSINLFMVSNIGGETEFDWRSIGYAILGGSILGFSTFYLLLGFSSVKISQNDVSLSA